MGHNCNEHEHEHEHENHKPAVYYKAVEKLTTALGLGQTLTARILTRVKSLSDRALDEEIRRQLGEVVGPDWNGNCIVGYWMMEIVRAPIVRLIEEGRAREINIKGRLTLRTRLCHCAGATYAHHDVCSICLDKMYICSDQDQDDDINDDDKIIINNNNNNNIATLDCGHEFHMGCVARWLLLRKNFCPLCKARALEIHPDADVDDGFLLDL